MLHIYPYFLGEKSLSSQFLFFSFSIKSYDKIFYLNILITFQYHRPDVSRINPVPAPSAALTLSPRAASLPETPSS